MPLPDVDTLDTYGGVFTDDGPVEDPTTDQSADAYNPLAANVAGMTHVVARAWARFTLGTTAGLPALVVTTPFYQQDAVWIAGGSPTVLHTGTGIYRVSFPQTVTDSLGDSHPLNLRWSDVRIEAAVGQALAWVDSWVSSAYQVTINCWNNVGNPDDLANYNIRLMVG